MCMVKICICFFLLKVKTMSDKFVVSTNDVGEIIVTDTETGKVYHYGSMSNFLGLIRLLNEQQSTISQLEEEKEYWKSKAMTLLLQVRRLTPRMTDKEVIEFNKELDDE